MTQVNGTSSFPPPPPKKGGDIFDWAMKQYRWLRKTQALPGTGLTSTQTDGGRTFNVTKETADGIFRIYQADGTVMTVTMDQAMTGYADATDTDNWSLEFGVAGSTLDDYADDGGTPPVMTNPIGTDAINDPDDPTEGRELLHDGDASNLDGSGDPDPIPQTYYRIPIIRDGQTVSQGGVYRENIMCAGSKGPIVELVRIG